MDENYFEKIDFSKTLLTAGEYENCTFIDCDFSNVDLSAKTIYECEFNRCQFKGAKLPRTPLREVQFKNCALMGLRFANASGFLMAVTFDTCVLNRASFFKLKVRDSVFRNSSLHEVDFTETDLHGVSFDNCDLSRATFEHTVLEKADFRTAYNYAIDPELNRIRKAKFSVNGLAGLLHRYDLDIE